MKSMIDQQYHVHEMCARFRLFKGVNASGRL